MSDSDSATKKIPEKFVKILDVRKNIWKNLNCKKKGKNSLDLYFKIKVSRYKKQFHEKANAIN